MPAPPRYLQGHFAPLPEERSDFELPVEGRLPAALGGQYVRTGCNPRPDADPGRVHQLAGAGMVHGVELAGGRAIGYRNRWIDPPTLDAAASRELLVPPGDGAAGLFHHAGNLYATAELGLPCRLSRNLETLGIAEFGAQLPAGAAPHARFDPGNGELHLLAHHFESPHLRHHRIDHRGQLVESRILPFDRPAMVHDFALTDAHLVVFDLPVLFSEDALLDGQPLPYRWQADAPARVGLVPRHGDAGDTQWFVMDACWIAHVAGARLDGGATLVDVIRRPARFRHDLRGDDEGPGELTRLTLDPRRGVAMMEILDNAPQDLPARDPRQAYGDSRWLWTTAQDDDGQGGILPAGSCLYRHDLQSGDRQVLSLPENRLAGECTFVPAHPRAPHGKGWLLTCAAGGEHEPGELLVLDASDPECPPTARVRLPQRIPFGSHGCWVPGAPT